MTMQDLTDHVQWLNVCVKMRFQHFRGLLAVLIWILLNICGTFWAGKFVKSFLQCRHYLNLWLHCIGNGSKSLSSGYNAWSRVWGDVLMLPLQFNEVTQNTDSKVLKLIVFDSANFERHSCSNLTSLVASRTILVTICSFCQKKKCIQINWTCKPVKAVISNDNIVILTLNIPIYTLIQ